jgi:hypothetical protein
VLCHRPRHCGVSYSPLTRDSPGALSLGDPLARDPSLQLGQLRLAAHMHPTLAGSGSTVVGTLHDPLALVITQSQVSILAGIGRILPNRFA